MIKQYICPKKEKARQESIINAYRFLFGDSLPSTKQYWSLCASCINPDGSIKEGTELHQIVSEGLIKEDQFYGVDHSEEVFKTNSINKSAKWFHGDFFKVMVAYIRENGYKFNPGIVNLDFINGPKHKPTIVTFANVIRELTEQDIKGVLVIGNFMVRQRYWPKQITPDEVLLTLKENSMFNTFYVKGDWELFPFAYEYKGTGKKSKTVMNSIWFYRK